MQLLQVKMQIFERFYKLPFFLWSLTLAVQRKKVTLSQDCRFLDLVLYFINMLRIICGKRTEAQGIVCMIKLFVLFKAEVTL